MLLSWTCCRLAALWLVLPGSCGVRSARSASALHNATQATQATHATQATQATHATHATQATHASLATQATHATQATDGDRDEEGELETTRRHVTETEGCAPDLVRVSGDPSLQVLCQTPTFGKIIKALSSFIDVIIHVNSLVHTCVLVTQAFRFFVRHPRLVR